jgi:hypothetical protein
MKIRMLLIMAAVAVIAMIAPQGHAGTALCGGVAPRESECSVEGLAISTHNPTLAVKVGPLFVGSVSAVMTGPNGKSSVLCSYTLTPTGDQMIKPSCDTTKTGTILQGDTVTVAARTTGKPGALPAVGSWDITYSA